MRDGVAVFCRCIAKLLQLLEDLWLSSPKPLFDLAFDRSTAFGLHRPFKLV